MGGGGDLDHTAISSDVIRGYIDVMILRVLYDRDSYGYEISKRITEISEDTYSMKETTLYSAFSRLEKIGYLRSYPGTYSGGRERTYYQMTGDGRLYYRRKCAEWAHTIDLVAKFILKGEEEE